MCVLQMRCCMLNAGNPFDYLFFLFLCSIDMNPIMIGRPNSTLHLKTIRGLTKYCLDILRIGNNQQLYQCLIWHSNRTKDGCLWQP